MGPLSDLPTPVPATEERGRPSLTRYAWLSIAAALGTIALKFTAYGLTGSVGLLSDAAESVVNLVAAAVALVALRVAAKPADDRHHYGHGKAEYFSAGMEGMMIFLAAAFILFTAVQRLMHPRPLDMLGIGLALTVLATGINGAVGIVLLRAGRRHRSPTLVADAKHLMTDVWTSAGVVAGIALVAATGWIRLDPVVAIAVGVNILVTGYRLVAESITHLLDAALPEDDYDALVAVLDRYRSPSVAFHALQTRASGRQRFMSVHVLVPGGWSVQRGHDLLEEIEADLRASVSDLSVSMHLEPLEDPKSYRDVPAGVPPIPDRSPG